MQDGRTWSQVIDQYIQENCLDKNTAFYLESIKGLQVSKKEENGFRVLGDMPISVSSDWNIRSAIISHIKSFWDNREMAFSVIKEFLKSHQIDIKKIEFDDIYERRVEAFVRIMKFLQEGEHTQEEIREYFSISEPTCDKYLKGLRDGVYILGKHIQVGELPRKSNRYDPSIHPVFMTLNLSEVCALTVIVKQLFGPNGPLEDYPFRKEFLNIADDVYSQLSHYAKKRIDAFHGGDVDFNDMSGEYRKEVDDPSYFLKSQEPCRLVVEGIDEPIRGCFVPGGDVFPQVRFEMESGEICEFDWNSISEASRL